MSYAPEWNKSWIEKTHRSDRRLFVRALLPLLSIIFDVYVEEHPPQQWFRVRMLWQQIAKYLSFGSLRVSGCVCRSQCWIGDGFRLLPREIFGLMWMPTIPQFYSICTFGNWNIADADHSELLRLMCEECRHELMPSIYRRACTGVGVDLVLREICLSQIFSIFVKSSYVIV